MEMGPQEAELEQGWGRWGPWTAEEEPGDGSKQHRSPGPLSRKKRPGEGRKSKFEHQQCRVSWYQRGEPASIRNENPETQEVDLAPVGSYLNAVFSLAKGEGLQGTGKRRWAARRRCQQQSQQQAVELTAAAGAGVWGAAYDLALLDTHDQG